MEMKRSSREKIKKMQELGIFEKWQANADAHARELYTRYAFPKDYIRLRQKRKMYHIIGGIRLSVHYNRVVIRILKISGRIRLLARNSRPIKRRNSRPIKRRNLSINQ